MSSSSWAEPSLRWLRLRAVWILVIAFLIFARPTRWALVAGGGVALVGLLIRGWSAGTVRKDKELATGGPYAHTRNPLYLGSFLMGLGVTIAGANLVFVGLFLVFFALVYGKTIRGEAGKMEDMFGDRYREWASHVPMFLPRLTPYRPGRGGDPTDGREEAAGDRDGGTSADGEPRPAADASPHPARASSFDFGRYKRNREYEAALGLAAGFLFLVAKWVWLGP